MNHDTSLNSLTYFNSPLFNFKYGNVRVSNIRKWRYKFWRASKCYLCQHTNREHWQTTVTSPRNLHNNVAMFR